MALWYSICMQVLPVKLSKTTKAKKSTLALIQSEFNEEFLASIDRAEKDIKAGRVQRSASLVDLR